MINLEAVCLDAYTPEDLDSFKVLAKDLIALFIYNKNVFTGGVSRQIDPENYRVKTEMRSDTVVAPVCVFEAIEGARVLKNSITVGKITLEFKKNSKKYKASGKVGAFSVAPFAHRGHTYVPVAECALALGLGAQGFNQNRLTVIGGKKSVKALALAAKKNPALEFAGGRAVVGEYDAASFTPADYKLAKDKWRASLSGSPETVDMSDPAIAQKVESIAREARELQRTRNRAPDRVILWGDAPPKESVDLMNQYSCILRMTLGYAVFGSELYKDPELLSDVLDSLKWMYENMYGEAELEDRGWRSIHAHDWWHWYVGGAEFLTDTVLLVEEHLTFEEKKKYLKVLEYVLDHWRTGFSQNESSGRMSVGTKCALILEDPVRLARAERDYHIMLEVKLSGPGTHTDYVNYQHGFPYNLMYGKSNINRVLKVGANLAGTPLEFSSPRFYNQFKLFRLMYEAAMYRGRGFTAFWGRAASGVEVNCGMDVTLGILPMIGGYGPEEDAYIRHFVKYNLVRDEDVQLAKRRCSVSLYSELMYILNSPAVSGKQDYTGAHAWYSADRASQHRGEYAFLVSMPSYRHPNYECINGANKMGWYMNDGTLYLYTKTDMNEFDGNNFVLNKRLALRMPGTTVDVRERPMASVACGKGWTPKSDKVGCMDFGGEYVAAAMDYEAYNCLVKEEINDVGYGGGNPLHEDDLVARKAYFMLDEECVCLGAGITSTMNSEVNTVVEHRRRLDAEVYIDGKRIASDEVVLLLDSPRFAVVDGFAGFVFEDARRVSVSRYNASPCKEGADMYTAAQIADAKEQSFVEILINHGKNPKNDTYAYAVLPYADEQRLKKYSEKKPYEILSNTPECQAVRKKSIGLTSIAFYEAGECAGIKADRPCIVTYSERGGEFKIKVCEPTNKADKVRLEILKKLSPISADKRYKIKCADTVKLALDTSLSVGEGYEAVFKKI